MTLRTPKEIDKKRPDLTRQAHQTFIPETRYAMSRLPGHEDTIDKTYKLSEKLGFIHANGWCIVNPLDTEQILAAFSIMVYLQEKHQQ